LDRTRHRYPSAEPRYQCKFQGPSCRVGIPLHRSGAPRCRGMIMSLPIQTNKRVRRRIRACPAGHSELKCGRSRKQVLGRFDRLSGAWPPIRRDGAMRARVKAPRHRSGAGHWLWSLTFADAKVNTPIRTQTFGPGSVSCRSEHSSGGKNRIGKHKQNKR